jgi:chloride channel protein, CIC family
VISFSGSTTASDRAARARGSADCPQRAANFPPESEDFLRKEGESQILLDTALLGVVGGLAALAFDASLRFCSWLFLVKMAGYRPPGLPDEGGVLRQVIGPHGLWLVPLVTTLGGAISGILIYTWAPEAEGHGTDAAVRSYHQTGGYLRARVAPLKMLASAITIGSGGSAGREGPTALIGAGFGSIYATLLRRSDEERRLLVLIGMGAGLSAIFRSPIGTALFATEVLYSSMEFEGSALLYTLIGSLIAYSVNGVFVGWKPLFQIPSSLPAPNPADYIWYAVLGLAAGAVGTILPEVFYKIRDAFHALPIPNWTKPALGGLGVGLLALELPQVLGGGYGWIQLAIDGRMVVGLLLVLLFAKLIAFALTVSSGGSGGVFAPSLFVGAMLGGLFAHLFHQPAPAFVVVGMAAVFGAAARVPIATLVMVLEMTHAYPLLAAAALAVLTAYIVQSRLSRPLKYRSLYEAQVQDRSRSPVHYAEQIRIAMNLLGRRRIPRQAQLGHISLMNLLSSGVSLDLPGEKRLEVRVLKRESVLAQKPIGEWLASLDEDDVDVIALVRGKEMLMPLPGSVLQPGDRVLTIASPRGRKFLDDDFPPQPPVRDDKDQHAPEG